LYNKTQSYFQKRVQEISSDKINDCFKELNELDKQHYDNHAKMLNLIRDQLNIIGNNINDQNEKNIPVQDVSSMNGSINNTEDPVSTQTISSMDENINILETPKYKVNKLKQQIETVNNVEHNYETENLKQIINKTYNTLKRDENITHSNDSEIQSSWSWIDNQMKNNQKLQPDIRS
jgi:hypothetical protein